MDEREVKGPLVGDNTVDGNLLSFGVIVLERFTIVEACVDTAG